MFPFISSLASTLITFTRDNTNTCSIFSFGLNKTEEGRKIWILLFLWTCVNLCFISYSAAFSHGASLAACSDMRPKHIRAAPQNTRKNYITIQTNKTFYQPGDKVPVTIRSVRDFMGFLLQARSVSNDQVAGSFVFIPPGSKLLHCYEDGDTVTHSDKALKRNLSFVWKSPDHPVGDIKFFLSAVQSYFVYWARIESSIVSEQVQNRTIQSHKPEVSSSIISPMSDLVPSNSPGVVLSSSYVSSKPPDTLQPFIPGLNTNILVNVESLTIIPTKSIKSSLSSRTFAILEPSLQPFVPGTSQNEATNQSLLGRIQNTTEESLMTLCFPCEEITEDFSTTFTSSPPNPTSSPNPFTWLTVPLLATKVLVNEPLMNSLEDTSRNIFSPSITHGENHEATRDLSANFLHHLEDSASDKNTGTKAEGTSPWVTNSINEVVPAKGAETKSKGMQLAMTQLSILLGCSAVLGMALAAALRCIHAQYCHKRTEVSFSEPDNNVITLRETGEMMQFRKIRENSFVLVQSEYNWIAPAGKPQ
ncbi:reelin domain-containing protein 1 [Pelodytes ibericus]